MLCVNYTSTYTIFVCMCTYNNNNNNNNDYAEPVSRHSRPSIVSSNYRKPARIHILIIFVRTNEPFVAFHRERSGSLALQRDPRRRRSSPSTNQFRSSKRFCWFRVIYKIINKTRRVQCFQVYQNSLQLNATRQPA